MTNFIIYLLSPINIISEIFLDSLGLSDYETVLLAFIMILLKEEYITFGVGTK